MNILITGSSGFVGQALNKELVKLGHQVFNLVRKPAQSEKEIFFEGPNSNNLNRYENFQTIIHLAGENIATGRWTKAKKKKIIESRVNYTRDLVEIVSKLKNPPKHFISASAIGIYGNRPNELIDEYSSLGFGFLADVCKAWEAEARRLEDFGIKTALLRIGMVLGEKGGALGTLQPIFSLGLGGIIGSGHQYMSWISIEDLVAAIVHILEKELVGPINLTSPYPVSNYEFTKTLGAALKRPTIFPLPGFIAKIILGEFAKEVLLGSLQITPKKLLESGYLFKNSSIQHCLEEIYNNNR